MTEKPPLKVRSIPNAYVLYLSYVKCDICRTASPVWFVDLPAAAPLAAEPGTIAVMCDGCLQSATAEIEPAGLA
jgi:hypothetical protein